MNCQNCGQDNPPEERYCSRCGFELAAQNPQHGPMQYVSFLIRLGANTVDLALVALPLYIFSLLLVPPGHQWENAGPGFGLWLVLFLLFYPLYVWLFIGLKGQTPGKMLFRIRVVNEGGGIPGLKRAALRELLWKPILPILIPIVLFSSAMPFSFGPPPTLNWNDKVAGTYVVKVRRKP